MTPIQFENLTASYYKNLGYTISLTPHSNDYGADLFAQKDNEKIVVQCKMYGASRKINRETVMQLHGVKDYFDCTKAVIATDGTFLDDALIVVEKLNIEILYLNESEFNKYLATLNISQPKTQVVTIDKDKLTFDQIWQDYIIPLKGKRLTSERGKTNQIINVNWAEIERLTSNKKNGKIKIEIFKQAINKLLKEGVITRDYINHNYVGRASSGVVLILSQVPFFHLTKKPIGLKYHKEK